MIVFDRALLRTCWDPYLGQMGYCYDGPFVAIKLRYCCERRDVRIVLEDISKLDNFLGKPHDRCFVLALACTQDVFAEAVHSSSWHTKVTLVVNTPSPSTCAGCPARSRKKHGSSA